LLITLVKQLKKGIKGCLQAIFTIGILFSITSVAHGQTPNCSAVSKFFSKDSINIVTFGASTVAGVGGFSLQPALKTNFENCYVGKTIDITNNGIPGETTTQGLVRFPAAIANRTGFVFIDMGANDAQAIVNKKMTISNTEKNMRYYIEESLKHHLIPIIGTIQFYNDKDDQFLKNCNLYVKQINALYKRLVTEYHIYLADINTSLGRDFSLYQDVIS
jgi:acyl-CoA thioesterase-1